MVNIRKILWIVLGLICLAIAYVGIISPWVPMSSALLAAAYCFSNGSEKLDKWINENGLFGPIIDGWKSHKIFPTTWKFMLIIAAELLLLAIWTATYNITFVMVAATVMTLLVVWIWRYPGSDYELDRRVANNKRIGWF